MAKLFPLNHVYEDLRNGIQVGMARVIILTTGSDFVVVGAASDAALLQTNKTLADPVFYLSGNDNSVLNIDGGTVGAELIVVTRHDGKINFMTSSVG